MKTATLGLLLLCHGCLFQQATAQETAVEETRITLSPGSFSEESIAGLDASGVPWLFIISKNERYLQEITAMLQAQSQTVEIVTVPGTRHATDILEAHLDMAERIAVWLALRLR